MFSARLITPPSSTAVSLSEAKQFLSIDEQNTGFDSLLSLLIGTATSRIEDYTQRAIVTQSWQLATDRFPGCTVELPMAGPLQYIQSISYTDSDGTTTTIDGDQYIADSDATPGRLLLAYNASWPVVNLAPGLSVRIAYTVGVDPADVPDIFKTAILYYTAFLFENRDADPRLPKVITDLLYTHRINSPVPILRGL